MPLWLWDAKEVRIVWANQACLDFSGALSIDDLIRLKFSSQTPFSQQLAVLARDAVDSDGTRELIRFPARDGEYIFDCLCKSREIEPGRAGVLVALVADKGLMASAPVEEVIPPKEHQNGLLKEPDIVVEPKPLEVESQAQLNGSPQTLSFDMGSQTNGFHVELEKVDEEDLQTLQEIARMINGTGSLGLGHSSMGHSTSDDSRPAVATRGAGERPAVNVSPPVKSETPEVLPQTDTIDFTPQNPPESAPAQSAPRPEGSERNYFLESLPAALAIAMGGRLMRANEAFLYAFGFGSEKELRKAGGLATLFPESQKGVLIADERAGREGQKTARASHSGQTTTLGVSRSGRRRRIPIAFRNVSTGRDPVQILILHEDALSQEESFSPSTACVDGERPEENGNKKMGQDNIDFLATVSHEVRTPLNSIIGFSELMKDERFGAFDGKKFRGYAADIHTSAMHALSLINDLLDITKIMAGKPDLDFETVKVDDVILDAMAAMRAQADRKKITLQTRLEEGLSSLYADRRSLKQILLNLISNAIKFTSPGGRVSVFSSAGERGGVLLTVIDTGIGMRKDQISTALEPYGQLDTARNRREKGLPEPEKGSGLGLPLAKALVKAHNATFVIDSTPGQGTKVEIYFPASQLIR